MLFIGNSKILFYFLSAKFRSASLGVCLPNFWCGRILLKSQCVCKSPSHPHGRVQESKIFGRDFLPLNALGRIFRLDWRGVRDSSSTCSEARLRGFNGIFRGRIEFPSFECGCAVKSAGNWAWAPPEIEHECRRLSYFLLFSIRFVLLVLLFLLYFFYFLPDFLSVYAQRLGSARFRKSVETWA